MSNQIQMCRVENYMSVEKLKFYPNNPRSIRPDRLEALKESIIERGFYQPILIWKKGNVVLAGNHRLVAVRELINDGWEFVSPDGKKNVLPVVVENVSENQAKAILFETNNNYAEWIDEKLKSAIQEAEEAGLSALKVGFTQSELDKILKDAITDAEDIARDAGFDSDEDTTIGSGSKGRTGRDEETVEPSEPLLALMLPKGILDEFCLALREISQKIDPKWTESKGFAKAVGILTSALKDDDVMDFISGMAGEMVEAKVDKKQKRKKKDVEIHA